MSKRPNVLVITTHDSGRHFGCYGIPQVSTPNVDALAAEGVRIANCFATVPICCASRASMMTGRYPQSHGLLDLCFPPFDWALRPGERHLSHLMRDAGYRTCLFGLQHETKDLATLAFDRTAAGPGRGTATDIADVAGQFLRSFEARERPFFAQVGFFESHTPFEFGGATPDESRGVYIPPYLHPDDVARRTCAALQGALRQADAGVGRLMTHLRESGLEENTIVVFTTDHGVELPRAKWYCYDPGIAIAMVMRWPGGGITGGRTLEGLVSNVDFVPTALELLGLPPSPRCEGLSFAAGLTGRTPRAGRDAVYSMYHKTSARSVRTERYKLIRYFDAATDFSRVPVRIEEVLAKRPIRLVEFFDLASDPNEFKNLAGEPGVVAEQASLDAMLWRWMESVSDPLLQGPVRTPSYENASRDYRRWAGSRG